MKGSFGLQRFYGRRGEQKLPKVAHHLPIFILKRIALKRRSLGYYDSKTLALFALTWRREKTVSAFMHYALFRRDLGFCLPSRYRGRFFASLNKLSHSMKPLALAMIAEVEPKKLASLSESILTSGHRKMAPLAYYSHKHCAIEASWLTSLYREQHEWQKNFTEKLRSSAQRGLCLVGNSSDLVGAGMGDFIDSHGTVVRFNLFSGPKSQTNDLGEKHDIWVAAPGFSAPPPEIEWVITTGPDMLFRRQNWSQYKGRLMDNRPVLTVPLSIWRQLVVQLQAPPSAGLLILAWFKDLLGTWDVITTVGIGSLPTEETPYHHVAKKQSPSNRHNWDKECDLLLQWKAEGLNCNFNELKSKP